MPPVASLPEHTGRAVSASRQLRTRTRGEHLAAEASLDVSSVRTPEGLAALLRAWRSVWVAVDRAAAAPRACPTARAEVQGPAAQALDWLAWDLADLPGPAGAPEGAAPLDAAPAGAEPGSRLAHLLATSEGSWGVAYVLRGSRLGGALLAPVLSAATRLPEEVATSYLRSAGTDPGREWVSFRGRLDACDLRSEPLVAAARWTFGWVGAELAAGRQRGRAR